jgi:hypothetical protein
LACYYSRPTEIPWLHVTASKVHDKQNADIK